MDKIHIACIGGWHSHARDLPIQRAKQYCSHIPCYIDTAWDDQPVRGREWAEEMNCRFEPDYEKLCADPQINAFIITAGTTSHCRLLELAAKSHKHVFMEKALCTDPAEAPGMRDLVHESGIHFTLLFTERLCFCLSKKSSFSRLCLRHKSS